MSGGVDSSVAAILLKNEGFNVIGLGMKLFDEPGWRCSEKSCCGSAEMDDARSVAEKLDIPFYVLDLTAEFKESVIDYFVSSYLAGETPNPCVPCNEILKFEGLLGIAGRLGAESLATGHYARSGFDERTGRRYLAKGVDASKDQSYFLYSLSQAQLARARFPVGEITKDETRAIAKANGLAVHDKAESQDICFAGEGGYAEFVESRAGDARGMARDEGPILDASGRQIGRHNGLFRYTIGQRRGLGVSMPEPVYVIDIDPEANAITVAPASELRMQSELEIERVNYVSIADPGEPFECRAMTRYRKPESAASLIPLGGDRALVRFSSPQEPTAPGQSVVLYGGAEGDIVLCGGIARRRITHK